MGGTNEGIEVSDSPTFLPCPFCGCESIEIKGTNSHHWRHVECVECGARSGEVRDEKPGTLEGWLESFPHLVRSWNVRNNKLPVEIIDSELRSDTVGMCVMCGLLAIVGAVTAFIEGPQFHHGLMIGFGSVMILLALWRHRALSKKVVE